MEILVKRFEEEEEIMEDDFDFVDEFEEESTSDECMATKKGVSTYQFFAPSKLNDGEVPLGNVIGHENQKKEIRLLNIV